MQVIFIGTGGWISPYTMEPLSILIKGKEEGLLIEAGEGAFKSFMKCNRRLEEITYFIISHSHGDHMGGLPTFILNMNRVNIISSDSTMGDLRKLLEALRLNLWNRVNFIQAREGENFETEEFLISSLNARHTIDALSFKIREKKEGKTIVYSGDTSPNEKLVEFSKGVDLLIHEASRNEGEEEEAHKYGHSTIRDVVDIAIKSKVKRVAVVHFYSLPLIVRSEVPILIPEPCTSINL